jgi:hypothetical protein
VGDEATLLGRVEKREIRDTCSLLGGNLPIGLTSWPLS